jgi:hypothetical protein
MVGHDGLRSSTQRWTDHCKISGSLVRSARSRNCLDKSLDPRS